MRYLLLVCFVFHLSPVASAGGRTWTVREDGDGDAPTVQAAIDSAAGGDLVLVGPGVYFENLTIRKDIRVLGEAGPAHTIIDGGQQSEVVCMDRGAVENLTLQNGWGRAGGVLVTGVVSGTKVLRGNVIQNNVSGDALQSGAGGGIAVSANETLIESNIIRNNVSTGDGGGIHCFGDVIVRDNSISGNEALRAGGGVYGTPAEFQNNVVVGNFADAGGGIALWGGSSIVEGNTVISNQTFSGLNNGAGIHITGGGSHHIANNLVAFNRGRPGHQPPPGVGIFCVAGNHVLDCNLTWENDVDETPNCLPGQSNIVSDPQFCAIDPLQSMNFFLQADSVCLPENNEGSVSCGLIGARARGCGTVTVKQISWGQMKRRYR